MSETTLVLRSSLPALVTHAGERARILCFDPFASNIRSPNTRQAYAHAAGKFMTWSAQAGVRGSGPCSSCVWHAWIELQTQTLSAPSVRQHVKVVGHLFDWLAIDQIVQPNPAASVRGPSHTARQRQDTNARCDLEFGLFGHHRRASLAPFLPLV
jgi:hypothetical protein